MSPPPGQVPNLVARAAAGGRGAVVELLARYRGRLRRMVAMRLDPRLRGRVDASDVIQEGYLDAVRRLDEAASKRYTRALQRLKEIVAGLPGEIPEGRS